MPDHKPMTDNEHLAHTAVHYITIWTTAAHMQAERIIQNLQQQHEVELFSIKEWGSEGGYISVDLFLAREANSYLFIMALHQLRMAALLFRESVPMQVADKTSAIIEKFDYAVPDVKKTRDALTHFDDYVKGRGHLHRNKLQPLLEISSQIESSFDPEMGFAVANIEKYTIRASITPDLPRLEIEIFSATNAASKLYNEILKVRDEIRAYPQSQ